MTEKNEIIFKNIKLFSIIFLGVFFSCFIIGLLRAKEVGKEILNDEQWIESYVADHTKVISEKNIYKLIFTYPKIGMKFFNDLSTNNVHIVNDTLSKLKFSDGKFDVINSQTAELSVGIVTSTMLAAHKDAIKSIYIKKPKSGIGAIITAISAAISGYWLGYKIGMPDLEPDILAVRHFLNEKENWKQIKKVSLMAIVLNPSSDINDIIDSEKKKEEITFPEWLQSECFKKLKELSMKISQTDYIITNGDFIEGKRISDCIDALEPKEDVHRKFNVAKSILVNPMVADSDLRMRIAADDLTITEKFNLTINEEMKKNNISREEALKKYSYSDY